MLTQERLRQVLHYDKDTGLFTWLVATSNRARVGHKAGTLGSRSTGKVYVQIGVDGELYLAHRLAWLYVYGVWPPAGLDHEDTDGTNNRLRNLRPATKTQNNCNRGAPRNNKSGFKGVSWHKRSERWKAFIQVNRKVLYLGSFDTPEAGHAAYAAAAREHHGEFARVA